MKRFSIGLVFCILCALVGASPLSYIYQVDDPALALVKQLSLEAGVTAPPAAGPLSGYDLVDQLARIDRDELSDVGKQYYDALEQQLIGESVDLPIAISLTLSAEFYTNTDEQAVENDWYYGHTDRLPFFHGQADLFFSDHVYGIFTYDITKKFAERDFSGASVNYPFLYNTSETNLENSVPHTAFLGASGQGYTLIMGRDTLSWGGGNTGNLLIGDHAPYHDFVHVSLSNAPIRYTVLALPMNELDGTGSAIVPSEIDTGPGSILFHTSFARIYLAQRIEADLTPRFRISLTEAVMHYTDRLDIRMFIPFMVLHNYQNFGEVNNSMHLEAEVALAPGWALNVQFLLDQFQTGGEQGASQLPPNAYGAQGGIKFTKPVPNGSLSGYVEGVYTSPFLYLRKGDNTDNYPDDRQYNLDFVHAVNMRDKESGVSFLGYQYGPDSIVAATHLAYDHINGFGFFGDALFIAQGERGLKIDSKEQEVILVDDPADLNPLSPSGEHPTYSLILGCGGSLTLPDTQVQLHAQVHWLNRWQDGTHSLSDTQIVIGASYRATVL